MHGGASDEPGAVTRDEVRVRDRPQLVEYLTAPVLQRPRADATERRLVKTRGRVEVMDPRQGLGAVARENLRQRVDLDAARLDGGLSRRERERRGRERDDLLVRADDLDESPPHDELATRGAVVGPQACDSRGPLVELSSEVCPDRRADAATAEPRVDREPGEVSAGIETARLVVDLAVADRSVLLVDGDNADPLVSRVVPPAILIAR